MEESKNSKTNIGNGSGSEEKGFKKFTDKALSAACLMAKGIVAYEVYMLTKSVLSAIIAVFFMNFFEGIAAYNLGGSDIEAQGVHGAIAKMEEWTKNHRECIMVFCIVIALVLNWLRCSMLQAV